jgi:hypothetical protein
MTEPIAQSSSTGIDRVALIVVTLVGMAMCAQGVGKVAAAGQWLSVQGIAGSLLGIVILGLVTMRLLGRPLPLVESDRAALVVVIALATVKVAIAALVPLKA